MSQSLVSINNLLNSKVTSPIDDHIENILITISQNPVTNIVSLAGTGKSTRLPIGIAEAGNKIYMVVSDNSVAESLTTYVKYISPETSNKIRYISQNNMKEKLYKIIREKGCGGINSDILMIDEADSESIDNFIIMSMWKYCADKKIKVPRLLLVSNNKIKTKLFNIIYYNIDTVMYPIEIRYWDKNYLINDYNLVTDIINLVYDIHSSIDGSFLIFAIDKLQIETIIQGLEKLQMYNVDIFPAHGDLTKGEVDRIYRNGTNRKIIVADRLAETTFTIDDLSVIIDMMFDQQIELSLTGGLRTSIKHVTKRQSNIRCKRGGRNRSLLCYRMVTKNLYDKLLKNIEAEIYRIPLHNIMLELLKNTINPYDILTTFDKNLLDHNYNMMLRLGVINTANRVTIKGEFSKMVPLGLRNSAVLYKWINSNYPIYPAIVLLSMIDSFSKSPYFVYPLRTKETTHTEYNIELLEHVKRYFNPFRGISDVHTYSNIWNTMMNEIGGPDVPSSDIKIWCINNSIRYENIQEVLTIVENIVDKLKKLHDINIGPFGTENTLDLLGPILANVYIDKKYSLSDDIIRVRYVNNQGKYYKIDSQQSINSIDMNKPDTVYGLITSTITSNYGNINMISCSLVV